VILYENARWHVAKIIKDTLSALHWEVLLHATYSCTLSDYHLFRLMQHGLAEEHFKTYEKIKKWFDGLLQRTFFYCGIYLLLEKWEKVIANHGKYWVRGKVFTNWSISWNTFFKLFTIFYQHSANISAYWDNARPHTSLTTQQKLRELGWKILVHPLYSAWSISSWPCTVILSFVSIFAELP